MNAMFMGMIVAVICYMAVSIIKNKLGYDDSLDAFGVHGVGGTVGTVLTGIFAQKAINAAGADGLLFGNVSQFLVQCLMVVVTVVFAVVMTFIIFKIIDAVIGMRVEEKHELVGLDLTQQSEAAYTVIE